MGVHLPGLEEEKVFLADAEAPSLMVLIYSPIAHTFHFTFNTGMSLTS